MAMHALTTPHPATSSPSSACLAQYQDLSAFAEVLRQLLCVPPSTFTIIRAKNRFAPGYDVRLARACLPASMRRR